VKNYDREVTLRELRKLLKKFDIEIEHGNGVSYHILKKKTSYEPRGWFGLRKIETTELVRVYTLSCGGEKRPININQIKELRKACGLSPDQGIDASQFYGDEPAIDYFIASYSKLLRRLGRT
jgi:death-on-curing protein